MELHRAFIDAAAKPLRHNLNALMQAFTTQTLQGAERQALLPDLWASLFLVVPLISTTFASVHRMLGKLPPQSLGWLFVDEAGQALPQAAVGALLRCRRAIFVGDPAQIEPVVTLPDALGQAICRRLGVDPDIYSAPMASAQTLADSASPYTSQFETRLGSRDVGVPLLVHRRCSEPMFGIANAIAYSGLMVQAKAPNRSAIRDALGPSAWFHVQGTGEDKWCREEGEAVVALLRSVDREWDCPGALHHLPVRDRGRPPTATRHPKWRVRRYSCGRPSPMVSRANRDRSYRPGSRSGSRHSRARSAVSSTDRCAELGWRSTQPLERCSDAFEGGVVVVGNRDLWQRAGCFADLNSRFP